PLGHSGTRPGSRGTTQTHYSRRRRTQPGKSAQWLQFPSPLLEGAGDLSRGHSTSRREAGRIKPLFSLPFPRLTKFQKIIQQPAPGRVAGLFSEISLHSCTTL